MNENVLSSKNKQSGLQVYIRLLHYVKPHWKMFVLSVLGFLLYSGSQPLLAKVMGWLTDAVYVKDTQAVYLIPLSLLGIYLVRGIGGFIGTYFLAKVSFSIVHTLRTEMFDRLVLLPNSYYEQNNSGHLISMITFNVAQVTGAATDAIKVIVREGITVIALLVFLFYSNWQLSLTFLAIAPLIAFVVAFASKRFKRLSKKIQVTMGDITHISSEAINGYKEVKSFGGEKYEQARFLAASKKNYRQNMKMIMTSAINTPVLQMIVASALSFLVFLALSFLGDMEPAEFISYIVAAGLLPKPIRQLSEVNSTIQKGIAAAESVFTILDEESEQDNGTYEAEVVQGRLEFKQVQFTYPQTEKIIISDLNLTIEPGQTIALVGRSGSGKSTLASLISRFYEIDKGDILLDAHSLEDYSLSSLRKQISLVTQDVTLFNDTIEKNIAYGALSQHSRDEVIQAAESAYAMEFINEQSDGIDTLVGEDGVLLSGGQRQRLAIARALLKNSPILILDEATSALDTESERKIQAALENVMQGRTTLVIAHRLSTIENADLIVVMDKGVIIEQGNHKELIEYDGFYSQLHKKQFDENE
ncbi:MAG: lipid A export permease/ATP-binding protein MsbA [gamma proteobacterium symbiont of Bathyaustriella thionipta]|nr:lipid A export permease/ATP-binding protein MsbA [gamma proteobacterium symbiont of Bathyaustriella thionipta]MCU7948668.1 lipid A export permease/ATP-binding protein MsbA [gamma proteobacterium symbiont of Bathyaustriella thionipta]MCU7952626.1 lipid A export permease/ATP-binding protein MsbA [gamma proteobacterium symbiont of Bathyaustriella thionipta]MCU7955123.1 lipid A export permease/ATP-binding protein MsbA [gamma proteobacterium symbiont of Bathyaustriella thionipta]MCU7967179.1 lipi